ncbi:MAG: hypothetical protein UX37_C0031G0004 [Microgenomates group bacterium GW2011_GWA2_46_16]|nr:MAG: hypothetical protein UX37_C0031G0004 [Microgenomates group bacterium GW2011_GWA2_46_16]
MDEQEQTKQSTGSFTYYLIGAVLLVFIAGGVYFLRPKSSGTPAPTLNEVMAPVEVSPTPGPITGLACERQWYNPVLGFTKYFLGVEGADLLTTKKVVCSFTVSVSGKVVATTSAQSALTESVSRGGGTFSCVSPSLELEPNVPTVVDLILTNDAKQTATCTQTFVLPQP